MRLHLPFSLRKSVLSSLVSMVALSLGSGSASAVTESEPQNLVFDGATLTWNTNTENKVFTNAAGESASFAPGDNVTFASDATASLGEDISAGQINIANGADVVIELADNGLNFDTLSMLGGSLDAGDSLNIAAGETLTVGSNGSVLKSDLVLEKNAGLSVDYAGTGSATSLNNSALSLQGGTRLQLSGCGNGDGKTCTLLTGVSELKDAQGNAISLNSTNNAIAKYFDTSQPGTGFWANGTLQLNDGTLQLVLHDQEVKDSVQIITRQTDELTYQYYAEVTFDGIEHTASNQGGAICGNNNISISNNGSVKFRENMLSSSSGYYSSGGAVYGKGNITINSNGYVEFSRNKVAHEQEAMGGAIEGRGSIILCDNGYVNFIENSVVSNYHACGAAIRSSNNLELNDNTSLIFSGNSAYTYHDNAVGGAIYGVSGITINNNGHLEFSNNTAYTSRNASSGGAIFAFDITTLSGNNEVRFSGNAVYAESSEGHRVESEGGAITAVSSIILSGNETVEFCKNKAYAETDYWAEAYGGAISGRASSTIALNDNGSVTFSGNTAFGSSTAYGGAIYGYNNNIVLKNNGSVEFSGNTASSSGGAIYGETISMSNNGSVEFSGNTASWGGAIFGGDDSTIMLSNNGRVEFSGNTASSSGGAIFGDSDSTIMLSNNGRVEFRENAANGGGAIRVNPGAKLLLEDNDVIEFEDNEASCGGAIELYHGGAEVRIENNGQVRFAGNFCNFGGAIYVGAGSSLSICNNKDVIFEKNGWSNNLSSLRVESANSYNGNCKVYLSAMEENKIEFRDSIYIGAGSEIYLNENYTDPLYNKVHKQQGDIIFTGKYTEQHLNELLAENETGRSATAEEIDNSRTSEVHGKVTLYGGNLRIEEQAVLKTTAGLEVAAGSEATVKVSNAELDAGSSDINIGESGTLSLMNGATVRAANVNIADGATFSVGATYPQAKVATFSLQDAATAANLQQSYLVDANLTFEAGSTLVADGAHFSMAEGSTLTFNALTGGDKINLVLTLGAEYRDSEQVILFSNADVVRFILDGVELDSTVTMQASTFFSGAWVNDKTTLSYDNTNGTITVQHLAGSIPEPTTATLSMLALAALAARRRRK